MNWGYKLMFAFIAFAGMMLYLVFRSFGTNFELVEKDYYKNELAYQQVIDGTDRAYMLRSLPELFQSGPGITLRMPAEMKNKKLTGSVWFYCAYDSKKDKKFTLETDSNGIQVFNNAPSAGTYKVKIEWNNGDENFYVEKSITIQ